MSCTIAWLIFVFIRWPSYYQAWTFNNLLYYCIAAFFALGFAIYRMIKIYKGNKLIRCFWVAFYITWIQALLLYLYIISEDSKGFLWVLIGLVFLVLSVFSKSQWATFEGGSVTGANVR